MPSPACLAILACLFSLSAAGYAPLDVTPSLRLLSSNVPVEWNRSPGVAYLVASSSVLRVNSRGLRWCKTRHGASPGPQWSALACNLSANALCSAALPRAPAVSPLSLPEASDWRSLPEASDWRSLPEASDWLAPVSTVFPSFVPRVSSEPSDWLTPATACPASGRVLGSSQRVYDVSACDTASGGWDLVYSRGILWLRRAPLTLSLYWTLVGLSLGLLRALSFSVKALHQGAGADGSAEFSWTMLLVSLVWALVVAEGDSHYVTAEDALLYRYSVAYVGVYVVLHVLTGLWDEGQGDAAPVTYNVIAGALQLVVARLYAGAETPYTPVVLVLVGTRLWYKMKQEGEDRAHLHHALVRHLTVAMDAAQDALLAQHCYSDNGVYLVALASLAWVLSDIV